MCCCLPELRCVVSVFEGLSFFHSKKIKNCHPRHPQENSYLYSTRTFTIKKVTHVIIYTTDRYNYQVSYQLQKLQKENPIQQKQFKNVHNQPPFRSKPNSFDV